MVYSISTESCSSSGFTMPEETDTSTAMDSDDIPSFFRHATVFVTGVTGFLGHVLISKLLSSCPDIRKIYILMREKKNRDVNERFQELFDAPIFEKLKHDNPKVFLKVAVIQGDCLRPNLGISEADLQKMQNEVNIVFHVAATVRFDAPLRDALNINVRSTRDLLEIAKKMKHLKSFVYVSTAFSYCAENKFIEEKLYEPPMAASSLITMVDQLSDKVVDKITPILLGTYPNTYVFTKAVAEGLFTSKSLDLPTSIFRPAIVISTAKEPIPGWINNLYGPTGIVAAAGIGLVRTLYSDKNCKANLVPCDYVINALIAVAWCTAKHWKPLKMNSERLDDVESRPVPVFNYSTSSTRNSLTWCQFMDGNVDLEPEMPFSLSIWKYSLTLNKNKFVNDLLTIFLHIIPALIVDKVAVICGKQPKLMKSYEKIHKMTKVLSYFAVREWIVSIDNVQKLWNTLSEKDRKTFDFDLNELNWRQYFRNHLSGIRLYIIKDSLDTIPYAIRKRRRLIITHYVVLSVIILVFSYFFYVLSRLF